MKTRRIERGSVVARALAWVLVALTLLSSMTGRTHAQEFDFSERSNPAGLIAPITVKVPAGTIRRVSEVALVAGGYRFGFWTINGTRQEFPSGQAYLYPQVMVSGPVDAVAHFFPATEDGDGDRLADWWEFWMFADRNRGPQDDDDGDGRRHEEEFRNGYSARFRDDVRAGGLSSRLSAPLRLIVRNRVRYTLRSEPLGLVSAAGELAPGGTYTTPYLLGDVSGFTFVGFEVDGRPVRDVTGYYLNRITVQPAADTEIVARYVFAGTDSDGDRLQDALEYQNFGNLTHDLASDPDADGVPIAEELRQGWSLIAADGVISGGIAARLSAPLEYDRVRSRFVMKSLPLQLIPTVSELVQNGTERTSPHVGTGLVAGYAFGYWSLNGKRLAGPEGIARRQVKATVNGATELVAHFFLPDQDSDGDSLQDWWEWNSFGTLEYSTLSDPDGDGLTLANERKLGLAVANRDVVADGGIAARLSAPLHYETGSRKRFTLGSSPRGIVPDEQRYLAPGSEIVSNHYDFIQLYSGHYFTHWTRNGQRVQDASGYSRNRTGFPLLEDTTLVAHFTLPGDDKDGDTLPDYFEFRVAGGLEVMAPEVDLDGDGLTLASERRYGFSSLLGDSIRDGGISSRLSAPATLRLSEPPLALMPERLQIVTGAPAGTRVSRLAVSPAMPGRSYQFALELGVGGDDNARFVMVENELRLASALDVTGGILKVRIRAIDDLGVVRFWPVTVDVVDSLIAPLEFRQVAEETPLEVRPEIGVVGMSDQAPVITVVSTPAGSNFDAASGLWSWTPTEADGPGVFAVTLRADNGVMTTESTFEVTVTESNRPPTLAAVPLQNAAVGEPWSLPLVASDPDLPANRLVFSLDNEPTGAVIHETSGLVTWTPGPEYAGNTVVFQAIVSDGLASVSVPVEVQILRTVTLSAVTNGSITGLAAGGKYLTGTTATLTAVPAPGYIFIGWTGGASGTANPLLVTVDADRTIGAIFTRQYTLGLSAVTNGSITGLAAGGKYVTGATATLTAVPADGYVFTGWTGGASGVVNPLSLTVTQDQTIGATFARQYTVTLSAVTNGSITGLAAGGKYLTGTTATLTAVPVAGYVFTGWTGGASGMVNPLSLTVTQDQTIGATFARQYTVTLSAVTNGSITGLAAGGKYLTGTTATLTAVPAAGYVFTGWTGGASGTVNPLSLTVTQDQTIGATFAREYTVTLSAVTNGSITGLAAGGKYLAGATATLTAVPAAGYVFTGWTGGASGTVNPLSLTVTQDQTIGATFARQYTVTLSAVTNGSITGLAAGGKYLTGATATLTAVPAVGYVFTGWTGGASGTVNPLSLTVTQDRTIGATFARQYTVTLSAVTNGSITGLAAGGKYLTGATATLTAVPAAGYVFTGWTGGASGVVNPLSLTVTQDQTIGATFAREYTVTLRVTTKGSITGLAVGGKYLTGTTATLTAVPAAGYAFTGWTGGASGTKNPLSAIIDGDLAVGADFDVDLSDLDKDGLTAYEEITVWSTDPHMADTDEDGVMDGQEVILKLDPVLADTDGDGSNDGAEIEFGGDALEATSLPIWRAELEVSPQPDRGLQLRFPTLPGFVYIIEESTDCLNWRAVGSPRVGDGRVKSHDVDRSGVRHNFLRVRGL